MRRILAVLPVAVLLAAIGCNHWPPRNDTGTAPPPLIGKGEPKAAAPAAPPPKPGNNSGGGKA